MIANIEIEKRLKQILVEQLNDSLKTERIHKATSLCGKGLGLDSLDAVSLIIRLEEEFDIFFTPAEIAPSLETFEALLQVIRQCQQHEPTESVSKETR